MDEKEKDPAFLFYSSDFLTGTVLMNDTQRGRYITALSLQHQKGHFTFEDLNKICKGDPKVLAKFVQDENGLYYNVRLEKEIAKRKKFVKSRQENGQKGGRPPKNKELSEIEQEQEKTDRFSVGFSSFSCDNSFSSYENEIDNEDKELTLNDINTNNSIDTNSTDYINSVVKYIVEFLNEKCNTHYKTTTKKTVDLIVDKLKQGFSVEDFITVIKNKVNDWLTTEYARYLRPSTLFGDKFEEYLNKPHNPNSSFDTDEFFQAALERSEREMRERLSKVKEDLTCPNGNS